ncbi:MAG: HD domain-containing protein [Turicibacter sp.]
MIINDSIYGTFDIEPIFIELIHTPQIQRLKQIHQGGASYLVNPNWNVTRYDHSVGTMLLIRQLGGSIEEQIAGLLHDISHTAFSHVIDFALHHTQEDYHEQIFRSVIENSMIPTILMQNGFNYKDILYNESKWTILEKSAPNLCADRIDYTLRDMFHYGYTSKEEMTVFLNQLTVINGEIVLTSLETSEWFVDLYYKEVIGFFLNPLNIYAYNRLSKALRIALEKKIITLDDLLKDDNAVLELLKESNSKQIKSFINDLTKPVILSESKTDYDIFQKNKVRLIDPTLFIDNQLVLSSQKSEVIQLLNKSALEKSNEGVFIKIIDTYITK